MENLEGFFSEQDKNVYAATQEIQDFLIGEKKDEELPERFLVNLSVVYFLNSLAL